MRQPAANTDSLVVIVGGAALRSDVLYSDADRKRFAERLRAAMDAKGWHQSELARQAGLARDSISKYIRGEVLPTPESLTTLGTALGVDALELLPPQPVPVKSRNSVETTASGKTLLRIEQEVSFATAAKVMALLAADK